MKTMYKVDYTTWVEDYDRDRDLDHTTWMHTIDDYDDARNIALTLIDMYIADDEDDYDIHDNGTTIVAVNNRVRRKDGIRVEILTM